MKKTFKISSIIMIFLSLNVNAQIVTNELPLGITNKNDFRVIPTEIIKTPDMEFIQNEDRINDRKDNPIRYAYAISVNYNISNSGNWTTLQDGSKIWRLKVKLVKALSSNAFFDKFWLPVGSKFFVYNEVTHQTIGAITSEYIDGSKNNPSKFATGLIYGEEVIFEYFSPPYVKDMPEIVINRIDYGYRFIDNPYKTNKNFGESGGCNTNVNCPEGINWQKEKNAIARISIVFPSGSGWCSCALINNTNEDRTPYVLTANHCLGGFYDAINNSDLPQCILYWNYEYKTCTNINIEPTKISTLGAEVKANSTFSDFALLKLRQDPNAITDAKLYYLGWDRSGNSGNGGVGIHHPRGDVKKISQYSIIPQSTKYRDDNTSLNGTHWRVIWSKGTTEGGSSGSPLINSSHKIIGQLHGGYASCNAINKPDWYGKFSVSWTGNGATDNRRKLQPWLDPRNTGTITLDGMGGNPPADLYIRDTISDVGNTNSGVLKAWASPDIWIEDMDGNKVDPSEDKDYNICVRIHNKSDYPSSINDTLILNWTKAGVDLWWNRSWLGQELLRCGESDIILGGFYYIKSGYIGNMEGIAVPDIPPHSSKVFKVKWHFPKPEYYSECFKDKQLWHYCLLARVHDGNPIWKEDESNMSVSEFVKNNENVAWRNITFLQGKLNKSTVSVGSPFKEPRTFSLLYSLRKNELGELLNKYADVYLNMSSNLFELWQKSDFAGKGFKVVDKNKILLTEPIATIERLVLQPEELYLLEAEVNFFTQEEPENNEFMFDIAEYVDNEKGGKELIGGETYIAIRNSERDSYFKAKAVDDKTVLPAEPVSFRAEPISEDAVYTWFDQKGDTVARGLNLTVTPTSTQHYKLEVVATADGFKDYDSVRATVRNGAIVSLSPNPTDNQLTITYRLAAGITNATIEISDVQNLSVQSYPIVATATAKTVSLAGLTAGTYVVKLIINGETVDTRQVIKN